MNTDEIKQRFQLLTPFLTENLRRRVAAAEAMAIGYGGISIVSRETGVSRGAIALGCEELRHPDKVDETRIRRKGGGRKQAVAKDPTLKQDLELLIEPAGKGAQAPLRWTSKSVRSLASELNQMNHKISHNRVADLLHELGYSLRGNQKTLEGVSAADRDAQFRFINQEVSRYQAGAQPVVFVDIKKRELLGESHQPVIHEPSSDIPELLASHGDEYKSTVNDDVHHVENQWVGVDIDQDTAIFAVDSIRRWWHSMGRSQHPQGEKLMITVDSGGSNGYRIKLWKEELQKLARELSLTITVAHLPPGTSKWSRIEHRLFSFHSQNWHTRPQVSHRVIVNMVATPDSATRSTLEHHQAPLSDAPPGVNRVFHREWNYTV